VCNILKTEIVKRGSNWCLIEKNKTKQTHKEENKLYSNRDKKIVENFQRLKYA